MSGDDKGVFYRAAFPNAPPSIGWDILVDHLGINLMDQFDDWLVDLGDSSTDLTGLCELLAEEVLRIANEYGLAPFDGTLAEMLEDDDTEWDWLIREDLMPFARNWQRNVVAMRSKVSE